MIRFLILFLCLVGAPVLARDLPLACNGDAPDWRLDLLGPVALFHFPERRELTVTRTTRPQGRDWPIARTLVDATETIVVLLQERSCATAHGSYSIAAQVLTRRGDTPVLLTGCCAVAE